MTPTDPRTYRLFSCTKLRSASITCASSAWAFTLSIGESSISLPLIKFSRRVPPVLVPRNRRSRHDDDGPDVTNIEDNSHHVVKGSGTDATAVLDGCTITAGNADLAIFQRVLTEP